MQDLNASGGRQKFMNLSNKIRFGFLVSIVPMLFIVFVTYYPLKRASLLNSDRQIYLISQSTHEKIGTFLNTASRFFHDWVKEDVFRLAIEFGAWDDLKQQMKVIQTVHTEFPALLMVDKHGLILEESRIQNGSQALAPLKGNLIQDFEKIAKQSDGPAFVLKSTEAITARNNASLLLFVFHTKDSSGENNGFFLAYLDLCKLHQICEQAVAELKASSLPSSRVMVVDREADNVVCGVDGTETLSLAEMNISEEELSIIPEGRVGVLSAAEQHRHVLHLSLSLDGQDGKPVDLPLQMVVSADEGEIMGQAHKILYVSLVIAAFGLLVIFLIATATLKGLTRPIANLVDVLEKYTAGDYSVRAEVKSRDEIGYFASEFNTMLERIESVGTDLRESESMFRNLFRNLQEAIVSRNYSFRFDEITKDEELAQSLNAMMEKLESADDRAKKEDWLKTGITRLSEQISGDYRLDELCSRALTFIAEYLGAMVGTLFITTKDKEGREEDGKCYKLIASYAYTKRKGVTNEYRDGEGLIGQAALEKKVIHYTDIPSDYMAISSSLGSMVPSDILIAPLLYEGHVQGVIELAANLPFDDVHLALIEQMAGIVAVALYSAHANDQLKELLEQTQNQSDALLKQQEELQKANQELEEQTLVLRESESRLQVQQEELQASNEEMEEKNKLLEIQKEQNEEKNRGLERQRQEIEEKAVQLEQATKYKSEFLSNMSHELRTPLNSIIILAKMLADNDEMNLTEDQIESAESIHRGGQTLLHLINEILDLSKIEAGRIELSVTKSLPVDVTKNFGMEFNHVAKEKGVDFITEVADNLRGRPIITDIHRMEQIIRNLLGNAFKFTEKGSVTLRMEKAGPEELLAKGTVGNTDAIAASIIDTGQGIPAEKLDVIFEAFRQVDGSISRKHGGTGLGLSISRELSQLLGGRVVVSSVYGEGTTFKLVIPRILPGYTPEESEDSVAPEPQKNAAEQVLTVIPEEPEEESAATAVAQRDPNRPKSALIIEDDPIFARILKEFFASSGYECQVAGTGEDGLMFAREELPTAIILDIGLPDMEGWDVLKELKADSATRHIPVHVISGNEEPQNCSQLGAIGYLRKPVDQNDLKSALEKIHRLETSATKRLLVVEDDPGLRSAVLKMMSGPSIEIETADTGKMALEKLQSNTFDCMILDLGLPDVPGFEVLDKMKKDNNMKKIPVIIFTGQDLSAEQTAQLEQYSASIVVKSAKSMDRLLDETALFLHKVEKALPEKQRPVQQREVNGAEGPIEGKKVLLVDDDMRNAFALGKFLRSKKMVVSVAENGQKSLEMLAGETPDIVLMDVMMPVMDGLEAMRKIREQEQFRNLPILALTAKAMESDRQQCLEAGANDYLSKPIDTTKLLSMMRIWLYK